MHIMSVTANKLADYFGISSLCQYGSLNAAKQTMVHHMRNDAVNILTRIIGGGIVHPNPHGIERSGLFESRK